MSQKIVAVTEELLLTRWSRPLRVLFLAREGQMSERLADTAVEQVKSIAHMIWQHLPPTCELMPLSVFIKRFPPEPS